MSIRMLASNVVWSTVSHLLGRGSLVVAAIILARNLDTDAFAAYSYFQLTVSMLAAYAAMGLGVTASRFFAQFGHIEDAKTPPIGTLWILSLLAGLTFSIVIFLLPESWLDGGLHVPRWLLAIGVFTMALGVVPSGAILGLERYAAAAATAAASGAVMVVGAVIAGFVGSHVAAMGFLLVSSLIQAAGNAATVLTEVGLNNLVRHSRMGVSELRYVVSLAGPMLGVSMLAASGSWVVGRIILAGPGGERDFSLYAIGLQWYALALFVPGMVSRVLLPRLARLQGQVGGDDGRALVRQGCSVALLAAVAICSLGIVFGPWLLRFYGLEYQVERWLIGAFLLAAIPSAPVNTIGNAIVASGGQKIWFLLILLWFVMVCLAVTIAEESGALGGAEALGFASLGLGVLAFAVARRRGLV